MNVLRFKIFVQKCEIITSLAVIEQREGFLLDAGGIGPVLGFLSPFHSFSSSLLATEN